ncbi:small nuclear ribonucleoprotein G-like [Panthera tigris]|uniref:small nuclear ribonucleoprotein G-like n=1 Tax=Panthera tigris TaxID=9694 RepID=UPI001C6FADD7|nr:small nuclear ribonucleoprotein G-like [Panthera tigris]
MRKSHLPKLKKFIDNKLSLKLNGGKHVQEILWEFNPFINLVIDECVEMATSGQQNNTRMVIIRRNTIIMLETLALEWNVETEDLTQGAGSLKHPARKPAAMAFLATASPAAIQGRSQHTREFPTPFDTV